MGTFTQLLYQVIFSTKGRKPVLHSDRRPDLYKYIYGILKARRCHVYRINGVEDHIHILTHIHPTIAISSLVKDIKISSGKFIKNEHLFKNFNGWQEGYGAFSYSSNSREKLIDYVINQEQHHKKISFKEELIELLNDHGVEFDERYLA